MLGSCSVKDFGVWDSESNLLLKAAHGATHMTLTLSLTPEWLAHDLSVSPFVLMSLCCIAVSGPTWDRRKIRLHRASGLSPE